MAKVNKFPSQIRKSRTQACIERYMKLNDISIPYIAKFMNVTEKTVYARIRSPERVNLEVLWQFADVLKCPISELAGGELPEEIIAQWVAKTLKNK